MNKKIIVMAIIIVMFLTTVVFSILIFLNFNANKANNKVSFEKNVASLPSIEGDYDQNQVKINQKIFNLEDFEKSYFCQKYSCEKQSSNFTGQNIYKAGKEKDRLEIEYDNENKKIYSINLTFFQIFYKPSDDLSKDQYEMVYTLIDSFNSVFNANDVNDPIIKYIKIYKNKVFTLGDNMHVFGWGDYILFVGSPDYDAYSFELNIMDKAHYSVL